MRIGQVRANYNYIKKYGKDKVINKERIVMSSPWNSKPDDRLKPQEREDFTEYMRHERWCEFMSGIQKEGATIDRDKLAEFGDPNGELYRVTKERKQSEKPRDTKQNNGDSR